MQYKQNENLVYCTSIWKIQQKLFSSNTKIRVLQKNIIILQLLIESTEFIISEANKTFAAICGIGKNFRNL